MRLTGSLALTALFVAAPARAELIAESEAGFVSKGVVEVKGTPADVWPVMTTPSGWWMDRHTYSGTAANLTLVPSAGGCFCEKLPPADSRTEPDALPGAEAKPPRPGSVEHMRVVYAQPGEALRMVGALGPLQSEAVSATLTMTLKPAAGGTRITWVYVVGGYTRYKHDEISKGVDGVLMAQLARLAEKLGPLETDKPVEAPGQTAKPPGEHRDEANAAFDAALKDSTAARVAPKPKPKAPEGR